MKRWTVAATLAVSMAILLPTSVAAQIKPGRGVAGVAIGDGTGDVRHRLGRPSRVRPPAWVYGLPLRGEVEFDHRRRVKSIWTSSPRQRTQKGIGPGSSLQAARRAYPRLRCHSKHKFKRCTLRRHRHDRVVATDFLFKQRLRIVSVHLLPKPEGTPIPK
jgi:hypothetical protein